MKLVIDIPFQIKECLNNENEWTALLLAELKNIVNNGIPLEQEPKTDKALPWESGKIIVPLPEPKTGHWTNGDSICPCCGEDKFKDLDADIWADWRPKYCPNCGAKMESEAKG